MAVSDDDFVNGNLGIATLLKDPEAYKYVQQALNPGGDPAIAAALEDYYTQQNKKDPQTIAAIDAYVRQQTNKDAMLLLGFAAPGLASAVEIGGKVWQGDYAGAGKQAATDALISAATFGVGKAVGVGFGVLKTAIKEGKAADNVAVAVGEAAKDAAKAAGAETASVAKAAQNTAAQKADDLAASSYLGGERKYWKDDPIAFEGNKVYQRDDLFDMNQVSTWRDKNRYVTGTNLERMATGRAPIGTDGNPVNLHHMLQSKDGPIAEVAQNFHQVNKSVLHINPSSIPSGIDRKEFKIWKESYWMQRASQMGASP